MLIAILSFMLQPSWWIWRCKPRGGHRDGGWVWKCGFTKWAGELQHKDLFLSMSQQHTRWKIAAAQKTLCILQLEGIQYKLLIIFPNVSVLPFCMNCMLLSEAYFKQQILSCLCKGQVWLHPELIVRVCHNFFFIFSIQDLHRSEAMAALIFNAFNMMPELK